MTNSVESRYQVNSDTAIEVLLDIIAPYYKSFPKPGHSPDFKKSLTGEEILNVLNGVHHVITEILMEIKNE